ncbi:hypothetical protein T4B_1990 [Trichinella pseudospiralis]|uniref:Uncharacterized protein n=2 Tax=Trichinella pseudospiralis TaxID=6337 RepID=A0A0V1EBY8_TRIPS|nr:hypothetical protein T4A_2675 [Trichinella pseudospiralis]KRY86381.1 hypothetical protein T4D_4527 [Trichinella pseudospiralis]KRZ30934.1 hypothetical protein T4B_1990 [Trichinella pseudospiralis]
MALLLPIGISMPIKALKLEHFIFEKIKKRNIHGHPIRNAYSSIEYLDGVNIDPHQYLMMNRWLMINMQKLHCLDK